MIRHIVISWNEETEQAEATGYHTENRWNGDDGEGIELV